MTRRMTRRMVAMAAGLLLASGCASTQLAQVWKAPQPGPPARKVLVVAVVPSETSRRMMEGTLADRLKKRGLEAVPGNSLTPAGEALDRAKLEELVRRDGYDAVLVSRYAGTTDSTTYMPGGPVGSPAGMGF